MYIYFQNQIEGRAIAAEDFEIWCYGPPPMSFEEQILFFGSLGVIAVAAGIFKYAATGRDAPISLFIRNSKAALTKYNFDRTTQAISLSKTRVAAPCKAEWKWMYGDDRVRFCGQCNLNVYNLSAMTREEAERLIRRTEGRLCARFYRRKDGTILTKNCPVGLQAIKDRITSMRTHVLAASLSFLAYLGILLWPRNTAREIGENPYPVQLYSHVEDVSIREEMGIVAPPSRYPMVQMSESHISEWAIHKVTPLYHPAAASVPQSEVVVKVEISESGKVTMAKTIKGPPPLRGIAEEAARQWKFVPTFVNGKPVRVESTLTMHLGHGKQQN